MKRVKHIGIVLAAICLMNALYVAGKPRAYLLGGGHTNMSGNQWRLDHNGLRSGSVGYVHNLVGVYIDGSYSCFFTTIPNVSNLPGGYGIGGGLCYEHQRGIFKFQLGVGVRYQDVRNKVNDTTIMDNHVTDARGYAYQLKYDFYNRVDRAYNLHAQIPILLGIGTHSFYFLTGVKVNYTFSGSSSIKQIGTTTATYNQFAGQLAEMDNHGLRKDVEMSNGMGKVELKTDVLFSFETGYEFGDDVRPTKLSRYARSNNYVEYRLRIAAFVDYGLLNICPKSDKEFINIPSQNKWDFSTFRANHVFACSTAQTYNVHNFYVGIKFTALIGTYQYKHCVLCSDFKSEADISSHKNKKRR